MKTNFYPVSERPVFPKEEERIYNIWEEKECFMNQQKNTKDWPQFSFYDGPPFATGTPHYGHITAGTIKDIVCKYAAMNGHYVDRRFGWDCHGLPVEHEIDKQFGIKFQEDYEKMGIKQYNAHCRSIVMRYSKEWESTVKRMGRWIDFKNDYKTLDITFMESVWYIFKQLFDKGLVYRGCKVMPYSTTCTTVLSNFEANQNYKDVNDPSIYVNFPLLSDPSVKLLVWTTTPWTLPSNLAVAVNPTFEYCKIQDIQRNETFIMAKCRIDEIYSKKSKEPQYKILETFLGSTMEGWEYEPIFDYFLERKKDGCFKILLANYVTKDAGTGVVHQAPGFGEDDYKVCVKNGIIRPDNPLIPLDANGRFLDSVKGYAGVFVKDADSDIKKELKKRGRLVIETQINHSYPFCWRSDTPLIYKAHASWFIKVTDIKEDLLKNNKKAYWIPTFAQEKRFNNWLENAEDWCFSRNRYWGNPIPIWVSDDMEEIVCIGSIQELKDLSGVTEITDLHREFIDHITIPSKQGKGVLKRIPEVFDCWFESGSMPYAQVHYPFSTTQEQFDKIFPADFIGEGIDQTRGWFYTLNVISTAVFNTNPYKNLIVNGLVLAQDGKKMSKRLKNYPDPVEIIEKYGADAIRIYLANSPLVRAETLNFKEDGVKNVIKDIFLPWYNAYRFLIQNIQRYESQTGKQFIHQEQEKVENFMDSWIQASCQNLVHLVKIEMEKYKLYTVVPKLLQFLENLTNWYVRLNRPRLKGENGDKDWIVSLNVLFEVIHKANVLMAPYSPFMTDMMYDNMKKVMTEQQDSILFLQMPKKTSFSQDQKIESTVVVMQKIIEQTRRLRDQRNLSLKQPLQSLSIISNNQELLERLKPIQDYIQDEVNVDQIKYETCFFKYVTFSALPNLQLLGKKLGKNLNKVKQQIQNLTNDQIQQFQKDGSIEIEGFQLGTEELLVKSNYQKLEDPNLALDGDDDFCILLDTNQDEKLKIRGVAREIINRIQKLRKQAGLQVTDLIFVFLEAEGKNLQLAIENEMEMIQTSVKKPIFHMNQLQNQKILIEESFKVEENENLKIKISKASLFLQQEKLREDFGEKSESIKILLSYYDMDQLKLNDGKFSFNLDGEQYHLQEGVHFKSN